MEYNVGQVVYLLNPKTLTIIPALVVEEVTRKTIEDQTRQYVVELPSEDKAVRLFIHDVEEVIFKDVEKLREHMLDNTRRSVEQLINNALDKKAKYFGGSFVDLKSNLVSQEVKEKIMDGNKGDINKKHMQKDVKDVIMNSNNNLTQEEK